jgi:hypothetical protein
VKTLEVRLSDEVASKIETAAHERGVTVEDLLRTSVEEKLARDAEFEGAAARALTKNAELYKRLS